MAGLSRTPKRGKPMQLVLGFIKIHGKRSGATPKEVMGYLMTDHDMSASEARKTTTLSIKRGLEFGLLSRQGQKNAFTLQSCAVPLQDGARTHFGRSMKHRRGRGRRHRSRRRGGRGRRRRRSRGRKGRRGRRRSRGRRSRGRKGRRGRRRSRGRRSRGRKGRRGRRRSRRGRKGRRRRSRRHRRRHSRRRSHADDIEEDETVTSRRRRPVTSRVARGVKKTTRANQKGKNNK